MNGRRVRVSGAPHIAKTRTGATTVDGSSPGVEFAELVSCSLFENKKNFWNLIFGGKKKKKKKNRIQIFFNKINGESR